MAGIPHSAIPASIWNNYSYLTFLAPSVGGIPTQILKADHFFMSHALLFKMCYTLRPVCLKLFLCIHTALELYAFREAHTYCTPGVFIVQKQSQKIGNCTVRLLRIARL